MIVNSEEGMEDMSYKAKMSCSSIVRTLDSRVRVTLNLREGKTRAKLVPEADLEPSVYICFFGGGQI